MDADQPSPLPTHGGGPAGHARGRFCSCTGLLALLALLSLLLGAAVNWGSTQQQRLGRTRANLDIAVNDLALLDARLADVTRLLVDPHTQLVPFAGRPDVAGRGTIAMLWNERLGRGAFAAERLEPPPSGQRYYLWLSTQQDPSPAQAILSLDAVRPGEIRPFHLAPTARPPNDVEVIFQLTLEPVPLTDRPPGPVLYHAAAGSVARE